MAEFQEVVRIMTRMCAVYRSCYGCPLEEKGCSLSSSSDPVVIENAVMQWAETHPEEATKDEYFRFKEKDKTGREAFAYSCAMERLVEAPTVGGWISVKDRLPESRPEDLEYPTVIMALEDGTVELGCYYESTREWGSGENFDRPRKPIAWMPLPEPPKEDD